MKKIILTLFAGLFILQGAMSCSAEETTGFFTTLKNAIVKDVQDTVTTTVTTAANKTLNIVKINQYKQQLNKRNRNWRKWKPATETLFINSSKDAE